MKKITHILFCNMLFITSITFSQTISTGVVALGANMSAQFDVSPSDVTLTFTGPDDRWFAMGVGVPASGVMSSGGDVVLYDGSTLTDRTFVGFGAPSSAETQDWSISSNTTLGGTRTIIATRSLTGSGGVDHIFSNTDLTITLAWAHSPSSGYSLAGHSNNRGFGIVANYSTLSIDDFELAQFTMYPNPARNFINVGLPQGFQNAEVEIYNYLGAKVQQKMISRVDNSVPTNNLTRGMYLMRLSSEGKSHSKTVIIQ